MYCITDLAPFSFYRYKGMASSAAPSSSGPRTPIRGITPQPTGFSQMSGRSAMNESSGTGMSVLLSWHEKVVEVAGVGSIQRTMTDWRRV